MKFGKIDNIEGLILDLPSDYNYNNSNKSNQDQALNFFLGCTAWNVKEWKGKLYPSDAKSTDYLYHYSRKFNSVELNSTHYAIPKVETFIKWKESVPSDFRFCPKLLKYISHSRDLGINTLRIKEFCNAISLFEENLGCSFMQLPPYFSFEKLHVLDAFLKIWPKELKIAIELRHPSFFENTSNFQSLFELISHHKQHLVITDVAGRRDVLHMAQTGYTSMVRYVGNNLHSTDYSRINQWIDRIRNWAKSGMQELYFFVHQNNNLVAPETSDYLVKKLNSLPGINLGNSEIVSSSQNQLGLFYE